MIRRVGIFCVGAALLAGISRPASAQSPARPSSSVPATHPERVTLRWAPDAPPKTCLSLKQVQSSVETILGRRVFVASSQADAFVDIAVSRRADGAGWNVRIRKWEGSGKLDGTRTLQAKGDDCGQIAGPTGLVLAMLVDRELPNKPATPLVKSPTPRAKPAQQSPVQSKHGRWTFGAGANAVSSWGMLPDLAFGAQVAATATPPGGWPLRLQATIWPGATAHRGSAGGRFRLWTVEATMCPRFWHGDATEINLCAGIAGGLLSAEGLDLGKIRRTSHTWGHGQLSLRGAWGLAGPVQLWTEAGALLPWNRPRFYYETTAGTPHTVFVANPVIPFASLGLGIAWK